MTNRIKSYIVMADAYIRDLNTNAINIGVAVDAVKSAEVALEIANQQLNTLRKDREFQIVELKGVRDILRKLEDADRALVRENEDGTLE